MSHLNVHLGSVANLGTRNREIRFTAITDISDNQHPFRAKSKRCENLLGGKHALAGSMMVAILRHLSRLLEFQNCIGDVRSGR
jgi:hypothetical protein